MRNTLICTVGTSLFDINLKNLSDKLPNGKPNLNAPINWKDLRKAYENNNWMQLAKELLKISPTERVCGAEINTIEEVRKKNWLSLENLIFLVSDTEAGIATGETLNIYFSKRDDLQLRNIEYQSIEQLQDVRPKDFKIHGLRNLVRKIGEYIQRFGGPNYVAIDATGGYKAQIAIAVVIGQSLNIPVYYKHERFNEIIDFPPMPIMLDYDILGQNADILIDSEKGKIYSSSDIGLIDEKLRVFFTEIEQDGETLYELNPIGQIYLTGFRLRWPKPLNLQCADEDKKEPTFGKDHHYPDGFKDYVKKVWSENCWIKTCYSISYAGQRAIKGTGFYVEDDGKSKKLIGTYKNDFKARFEIHLTDESAQALTWAADQLNQKYRE